jgi:hypothetical protein
LRKRAFATLPAFLDKIENETRTQVLEGLRIALKLTINDRGIVDWLVEYWQFLSQRQIHIINFFEKKNRKNCYMKL